MNWIVGIVRGTPVAVYLLFALLVWSGIRATRSRVVGLERLLITPAVFLFWGAVTLATRSSAAGNLLADWFMTAMAGLPLALLSARIEVRIDHTQRSAMVPGSWAPLARSLLIFSAKYGLGIATALHWGPRHRLALIGTCVSGASFGYFAGWTALLYRQYRRSGSAGRLPILGNPIRFTRGASS